MRGYIMLRHEIQRFPTHKTPTISDIDSSGHRTDASTAPAQGYTLLEFVAVMGILFILSLLTVDSLVQWMKRENTRKPILEFHILVTRARYLAVLHGVHVGVFPLITESKFDPKVLKMRICRDGNSNGLHNDEMEEGIDPCEANVHNLYFRETTYPGFLSGPIPEIPPAMGFIDPGSPLRLGASHAVICNPWGICTSGRIFFIIPGSQTQYAVKIIGHLGIIQTWRYKANSSWHEVDDL